MGWGGEMDRKGQKLLGWDKSGLTELQTKRTVTTKILIRRTYKTKQWNAPSNCDHQMPITVPSCDSLAPGQCPLRLGTQDDGTWYPIPCFVWPLWVSPPSFVPSWLLVKINPVLAKLRRKTYLIVQKKKENPKYFPQ